MFDSTQPLGLPSGSVRAIVTLFLTGAIVGAQLRGIALEPSLVTTWQALLAAYVGTRAYTNVAEAKASAVATAKK
jgi:hypothetical protein